MSRPPRNSAIRKSKETAGSAFPAPKELVKLLHNELTDAMAPPEIRERLISLGFDPVASTPEQFAARIEAEIRLWGNVIRASVMKPQ